jgi:hypothetical protein
MKERRDGVAAISDVVAVKAVEVERDLVVFP